MKKGEQFRQIFTLLSEGYAVKEIIAMGFPERTVYWAQSKAKQGAKPEPFKTTESMYVRYLRRKGLLHECGDGRTGILDEVELLTDEGIIFQLTCDRCMAVTKTRFETWTDDSKDRYLEYKRGRLSRQAPPPIVKML